MSGLPDIKNSETMQGANKQLLNALKEGDEDTARLLLPFLHPSMIPILLSELEQGLKPDLQAAALLRKITVLSFIKADDNVNNLLIKVKAFIPDQKTLKRCERYLPNSNEEQAGEILCTAAAYGKLPIVKHCIACGGDVNAFDDAEVFPAIEHAAERGHLEIIKFLLPKVNFKDERYEDGIKGVILRVLNTEDLGTAKRKEIVKLFLPYLDADTTLTSLAKQFKQQNESEAAALLLRIIEENNDTKSIRPPVRYLAKSLENITQRSRSRSPEKAEDTAPRNRSRSPQRETEMPEESGKNSIHPLTLRS